MSFSQARADETALNLYLMIRPPEAVATDIATRAARLKAEHGLAGRLRPTEILHVTLFPLGWYADALEEALGAARRVGESIATSAFDLTLDRFMSFGGERSPFVLCGEAPPLATELGAATTNAVKRHMPWLRGRTFRPHMTLLYDRKRIAPGRLDEPISFPVDEIVLINSFHGQTRYETLGRWSLRH